MNVREILLKILRSVKHQMRMSLVLRTAVTKPCQLLQRYPVKVNAGIVDDDQCVERHLKAIKEVMEKARHETH